MAEIILLSLTNLSVIYDYWRRRTTMDVSKDYYATQEGCGAEDYIVKGSTTFVQTLSS